MPTQPSASAPVRVADLMSAPLVTCSPDVPVSEVAALMASHRIHAVVVRPDPWVDDPERWGVISDLDLVGAALARPEETAAEQIAAGPTVVVDPDAQAVQAAALMSAHAVTHLLVASADSVPMGIVSALDIAHAIAPPPEQPAEDAAAPARSLRAAAGDRLVIRGHHLGEPDRDAEVLEARGEDGGPPFLVRWSDDGRVSLLYPGSDAHVDRLTATD